MRILLFSVVLLCAVNISKAMESSGNSLGDSDAIVRGYSDDENGPCITLSDMQRFTTCKRNFTFKSIATIQVGNNSSQIENIKTLPLHLRYPLFVQQKERRPYTGGNGGLLNPILKEYTVVYVPIEDQNSLGMKIKVEGLVGADGIAAEEFDSPNKFMRSPLEQVILGFIKESEISDECADKFLNCIKNEWTSKKDRKDTGRRTCAQEKLIQQHMHLGYDADDTRRIGERIRRDYLYGDRDRDFMAGVTLNTLTIGCLESD